MRINSRRSVSANFGALPARTPTKARLSAEDPTKFLGFKTLTCPVNGQPRGQTPEFPLRCIRRGKQASKAGRLCRQFSGTADKAAGTARHAGSGNGPGPQHLGNLRDVVFRILKSGANAPIQQFPGIGAAQAVGAQLDPGTTAGKLFRQIDDSMTLGAGNEPDQPVTWQALAGQDTGALGHAFLRTMVLACRRRVAGIGVGLGFTSRHFGRL